MKSKDKKPKIKFSTKAMMFFLATLIILFVFGFNFQYAKYQQLSEQENELADRINDEKKKEETYQRELKFQDTDEYIMNIARRELDMLMPDEMKIIVDTK